MIKVSKGSDTLVKVTFIVSEQACDLAVSVVGDFNDWNPMAMPLRKRSNGTKSVSIELPPGTSYRFKYLAEGGVWFCDSTTEIYGEGEAADSILVL